MKTSGTRQHRAETVGRLLEPLCDGLGPAVWEARRHDLAGFRRVQSGAHSALLQGDFEDAVRRNGCVDRPMRQTLNDPRKTLALLRSSSRIRNELFGEDPSWLRHIATLTEARNCWAHLEPISERLCAQALNSAEHLLRGISAFSQADQVAALRDRVPSDALERLLEQRERDLERREQRIASREAEIQRWINHTRRAMSDARRQHEHQLGAALIAGALAAFALAGRAR